LLNRGFLERSRFAFFFSSRRRHTRCYRDWSSDVCSSDLVTAAQILNVKAFLLSICAAVTFTVLLVSGNTMAMSVRERVREVGVRSEERRVGKEWRTSWSA